MEERLEEKNICFGTEREQPFSLIAIRAVCEALGPDANAQAVCPIGFNAYLEEIGDHSRLTAYRGNRFNVIERDTLQ